MAAKMAHGYEEESVTDVGGTGEAGVSTNGGAKQDTLLPTVDTSNVNNNVEGKKELMMKVGVYGLVNAMMAIPILYGYAAIIFRSVGPYFFCDSNRAQARSPSAVQGFRQNLKRGVPAGVVSSPI